MNFSSTASILTFVVLMNSLSASAQNYNGGAYFPPPTYSQPVYMPSATILPSVVATDPFAACQCGSDPGNPNDCQCKRLDCKIRLPQNCKVVRGPHKTPIPCTVYGKVPKCTATSYCTGKKCEFEYVTDVPEIHCVTDICNEIGKKTLQCLPGCCFSVCVPLYECKSEKVECKLTSKNMKMELWTRTDKGQLLYDVYVINDANEKSAYHAGGMPGRWLILHCGTAQDLSRRFPGAVCSDGTPFPVATLDKKVAPEATKADVNIELITDKQKIKEHLKKAAAETATADDRKFIAISGK